MGILLLRSLMKKTLPKLVLVYDRGICSIVPFLLHFNVTLFWVMYHITIGCTHILRQINKWSFFNIGVALYDGPTANGKICLFRFPIVTFANIYVSESNM